MIKKLILVLLLMTMGGYAGGKNTVPAESPVQSVEDRTPFYIGAGLVWGRYNDCTGNASWCTYEDVTYGGMVRVGYEWNQYIGVEARAISTFWEADPLGGEKLQHVGVYAKPMMPLGEDFNLYGLIGYGWTTTSTELSGSLLPTVDDSGLSLGIGLEYDLSSKKDDRKSGAVYDREFDGQADQENGWGLFIDYQRLLVKSGVPDMDVVSVGLTYDF